MSEKPEIICGTSEFDALWHQLKVDLCKNGSILIRFITIMGMFWGVVGSAYGLYWMFSVIYDYYTK